MFDDGGRCAAADLGQRLELRLAGEFWAGRRACGGLGLHIDRLQRLAVVLQAARLAAHAVVDAAAVRDQHHVAADAAGVLQRLAGKSERARRRAAGVRNGLAVEREQGCLQALAIGGGRRDQIGVARICDDGDLSRAGGLGDGERRELGVAEFVALGDGAREVEHDDDRVEVAEARGVAALGRGADQRDRDQPCRDRRHQRAAPLARHHAAALRDRLQQMSVDRPPPVPDAAGPPDGREGDRNGDRQAEQPPGTQEREAEQLGHPVRLLTRTDAAAAKKASAAGQGQSSFQIGAGGARPRVGSISSNFFVAAMRSSVVLTRK